MGCGSSQPSSSENVRPLYERTMRLRIPVSWQKVSEDAKFDYFFLTCNGHQMAEFGFRNVQGDRVKEYRAKSVEGGLMVHSTTAEERSDAIQKRSSVVVKDRTRRDLMVESTYLIQAGADEEYVEDAANIKAKAMVVQHSAWKVQTVADGSLVATWTAQRLEVLKSAPRGIKESLGPLVPQISDAIVDALENAYSRGQLPKPLPFEGTYSVLPVAKADLPMFETIAKLPVVENQVVERKQSLIRITPNSLEPTPLAS